MAHRAGVLVALCESSFALLFMLIMQRLTSIVEQLSEDISFEMIGVEGGPFKMGNAEEDAFDHELPVHEVGIENFYLGKFPLTQDIWKKVMGTNPSSFEGNDRPVETVSWNDVQEFLQKLNEQTGKKYRLPTEAEWEYAARGGKYSEEYLYAGSDKLKEVGWYIENEGNETRAVGQKMANELGLYDMNGNVWEWVEDQWHDDYKGAPVDGSAWVDLEKGSSRVVRGGGYGYDARDCRVSDRANLRPYGRSSNIGFRLALSFESAG